MSEGSINQITKQSPEIEEQWVTKSVPEKSGCYYKDLQLIFVLRGSVTLPNASCSN